MLVTVSDWGDNKGQRATHSLIKWLTFTASILSLVLLIPLNFSYDIVKIVFLIVTKSRNDKTIRCSVTAELNMQFCNEQTRAQPLFSPPCASATYGSARMSRRKNRHSLYTFYWYVHNFSVIRFVSSLYGNDDFHTMWNSNTTWLAEQAPVLLCPQVINPTLVKLLLKCN